MACRSAGPPCAHDASSTSDQLDLRPLHPPPSVVLAPSLLMPPSTNPPSALRPGRPSIRGIMRPFLLFTVVVGAQGTVIATTTPRSPFANKALEIVSNHHIVKSNPYTEWFATGEATIEQSQELVQQFSVFSNLFLLAQLNKVINAPTLDEMREGKEILANEIGVVFKPKSKRRQDAWA